MGLRHHRGETLLISETSAVDVYTATPQIRIEYYQGEGNFTVVQDYINMSGSFPLWSYCWEIPGDQTYGDYRYIVKTTIDTLIDYRIEAFAIESAAATAPSAEAISATVTPATAAAVKAALADDFSAVAKGVAIHDLQRRFLDPTALLEELLTRVKGAVSICRMNESLTVSNPVAIVHNITSVEAAFGYACAFVSWDAATGQGDYVQLDLQYPVDLSACSALSAHIVADGAGSFLRVDVKNRGAWQTGPYLTFPDGSQNKKQWVQAPISSLQRDQVEGFRFILDGTAIDVNRLTGYQDIFGQGFTRVNVWFDQLEGVLSAGKLPLLTDITNAIGGGVGGLAQQSTLEAVGKLWKRSYDVLRILADYAMSKVFMSDFDDLWEVAGTGITVNALTDFAYHGGTALRMVVDLATGTGAGNHIQYTYAAGNELNLSNCDSVTLKLKSSVSGTNFFELGLSSDGTTWSWVAATLADGKQNEITTISFDVSGVAARGFVSALRLRMAHGNVDVNSAPGDQWPMESGVTHAQINLDRLEGSVNLEVYGNPGSDWE